MNEEDTREWAGIVDRHAERVIRIAFRIVGSLHDAEDVAQEVFAEALSVHRSGRVRTWTGLLVRLATLRAIDRVRRNKCSAEVALSRLDYPAPLCPPDQNIIAAELAQWLRDEIRRLPEQQGAIFSMAYFEELSRNDIASALDITPEAVAAEWKQNSVAKTIGIQPGPWVSAKIDPPKPKRTVSINVEKALLKARELQPGVDAERFLVTYFAPYTVTEDRTAGSDIVDGVMTIELTKQQELQMKQMLSGFEQSGLWQVVTELRIIDTNIQLLDQFDWSASKSTARFARLDHSPGLDDEALWGEAALSLNALDARSIVNEEYPIEQSVSMPIRAAKISRIQSEQFLHQVQQDIRSNIMQAPKVTLFNGQSATIADVVKRPFVTDVVEIMGEKSSALQPKISVFEDGWKLQLNTTVTAEKQTGLKLVLTNASVEGVKLANLPNGRHNSPDKRVTIQVPTVKSDSIAVECVLEESEALLIFSPKPYGHELAEEIVERRYGMGQVLMIRTQLISDSDFLKSFVPE